MCATILYFAMLAQSGVTSNLRYTSSLQKLEATAEADAARSAFDKANSREAAFEEQLFVQRYNELLDAMQRFSIKYKAEHVIDIKRVESIKKAYHNLEKADPWFKVTK